MRKRNRRNFIIFTKHRRLTRLWQFFFTGWGLVMVAALVAGALFTRQLIWTPISAINMTEIVANQFRMTNASFAGTDQNGEPFKIHARVARQEYDNQNLIYMDSVSGVITRVMNRQKVTNNISANRGEFNRAEHKIRLIGNVRVDASNGDKLRTEELVIKL